MTVTVYGSLFREVKDSKNYPWFDSPLKMKEPVFFFGSFTRAESPLKKVCK